MPITAAVFDLGGVVLEIDYRRSLAHLAAHTSLHPDELHARWVVDEPYRHHETGRLADEGWFDHLRGRLSLACDAAQVRTGWNAMLVAPIAPALALVRRLRDRVPCYAFSNTNEAHLAQVGAAFPEVLEPFTGVFASHRIGHRKPDAAAYQHVLAAIGHPPGQVLFFDDRAENVEAGQLAGMASVLVRTPEDIEGALRHHGLLA